jgi:hypothetical protein
MIAFINKEDVDNNPSWIPGSNKLPLTVADAVHAVNVLSKKLNTIVEIEIRLMPKYKNKWHYLIKKVIYCCPVSTKDCYQHPLY